MRHQGSEGPRPRGQPGTRRQGRVRGDVSPDQGRASHKKALKGLPHRQKFRGYGHSDDAFTLVPEEAAFVREWAEQRRAGGEPGTWDGIVRGANALGSRTTGGKLWTRSAMKQLMTSARIAGCREYDRP